MTARGANSYRGQLCAITDESVGSTTSLSVTALFASPMVRYTRRLSSLPAQRAPPDWPSTSSGAPTETSADSAFCPGTTNKHRPLSLGVTPSHGGLWKLCCLHWRRIQVKLSWAPKETAISWNKKPNKSDHSTMFRHGSSLLSGLWSCESDVIFPTFTTAVHRVCILPDYLCAVVTHRRCFFSLASACCI